MHFRDEVCSFEPLNARDAAEQTLILRWIDSFPDTILTRRNEFAHATASAMIFDPFLKKVLMAYHNIYDSWAWTGGHADGEEEMLRVAIREAQEESGLAKLEPITLSPTGLDILTVKGHTKHGKWVPAHLHLSLCYSFIADPAQPIRCKPDENSGVRWIEIDRLAEYVSEPDMLPVYNRIIERTKELR